MSRIIAEFVNAYVNEPFSTLPACLWTMQIAGQPLAVRAEGDAEVDPWMAIESGAAFADVASAVAPIGVDGVLYEPEPALVTLTVTGPAAAAVGAVGWASIGLDASTWASSGSSSRAEAALESARAVWDRRRASHGVLDVAITAGPDFDGDQDARQDLLAPLRVLALWVPDSPRS